MSDNSGFNLKWFWDSEVTSEEALDTWGYVEKGRNFNLK